MLKSSVPAATPARPHPPRRPAASSATLDLRATAKARADERAEARRVASLKHARASRLSATPGTQHPRRSVGTDIVRLRQATLQAATAAATHASRATARAVAERPRVVTPHRRLNVILEFFQYPFIAAAALGAAYSATVGQWLIVAYGLLALATRRSSRLSFGMALFLLITIPFFQALGQSGIAENAAIYTYELLVVGTIQTVLELRKTSRTANLSANPHGKM